VILDHQGFLDEQVEQDQQDLPVKLGQPGVLDQPGVRDQQVSQVSQGQMVSPVGPGVLDQVVSPDQPDLLVQHLGVEQDRPD
jgi:hypothetical protein